MNALTYGVLLLLAFSANAIAHKSSKARVVDSTILPAGIEDSSVESGGINPTLQPEVVDPTILPAVVDSAAISGIVDSSVPLDSTNGPIDYSKCRWLTDSATDTPVIICNIDGVDFQVDSSLQEIGAQKISVAQLISGNTEDSAAIELANKLEAEKGQSDVIVANLTDNNNWLYQQIFQYLLHTTHDEVAQSFDGLLASLSSDAEAYLNYVRQCRIAELDDAIAREKERSALIIQHIEDAKGDIAVKLNETEVKISNVADSSQKQFLSHSSDYLASQAEFIADSTDLKKLAQDIVDQFQQEQRSKVQQKVQEILGNSTNTVGGFLSNTESSFESHVQGLDTEIDKLIKGLIGNVDNIDSWDLIQLENFEDSAIVNPVIDSSLVPVVPPIDSAIVNPVDSAIVSPPEVNPPIAWFPGTTDYTYVDVKLSNDDKDATFTDLGGTYQNVKANWKLSPGFVWKLTVKLEKNSNFDIGVTSQPLESQRTTIFANMAEDWGIWSNNGHSRHANIATAYRDVQSQCGEGDTVGIVLDSKLCRLGFEINGKMNQWAFENEPELCQGDFWFVVAAYDVGSKVNILVASQQ